MSGRAEKHKILVRKPEGKRLLRISKCR